MRLRLGELLLARGDGASAGVEGAAALAVQPGSLAANRLIERATAAGAARDRRPGGIAIARAVNALFFVALSIYCFLAYTPFAYDAFIKPGVNHALWFFIVIAPALFSVVLLVTG